MVDCGDQLASEGSAACRFCRGKVSISAVISLLRLENFSDLPLEEKFLAGDSRQRKEQGLSANCSLVPSIQCVDYLLPLRVEFSALVVYEDDQPSPKYLSVDSQPSSPPTVHHNHH